MRLDAAAGRFDKDKLLEAINSDLQTLEREGSQTPLIGSTRKVIAEAIGAEADQISAFPYISRFIIENEHTFLDEKNLWYILLNIFFQAYEEHIQNLIKFQADDEISFDIWTDVELSILPLAREIKYKLKRTILDLEK